MYHITATTYGKKNISVKVADTDLANDIVDAFLECIDVEEVVVTCGWTGEILFDSREIDWLD